MAKKLLKVAAVMVIVLLPLIFYMVYVRWTALPKEITIATGPEGGLYRELSDSLARRIETELGIKVHMIETRGSVDNLLLLQSGRADFALYQPGSLEVIQRHDSELARKLEAEFSPPPRGIESVAFVARLYSQPVHLVVRRDAGIRTPTDLKGKSVSLGSKFSGDYAASLFLLDHFGLDASSIQAEHLSYQAAKQRFSEGKLDAAFITIGTQAPILPELFATGECDLLEIPYAEALTVKYGLISTFGIPKGLPCGKRRSASSLPMS
jgi:TRAP transporter TAXI family solute receptor